MSDHVVREIMTPNPVTVSADASLRQAAELMKKNDIGDVLVTKQDKLCGIVTDRDLVVRGMATGLDPDQAQVGEFCTTELTTIAPDADTDKAVKVMRDLAIRRLPVVEDGRPVGIISLGDLALEKDRKSALADISSAPANN